jgi:hypothetical protein
MFRQHTRVAGAYRVTFSSEAWSEIGRLSSPQFIALQQALEQLAQQSRPGTSSEGTPTQFTFTVDSLVIRCERDDTARTLTLQHLAFRPSGSGRLPG